MHTNDFGWKDTIVALATPQGIGAIGVVRVSGEHAIEYVNNLFPSKDLRKQKSHTLQVGFLVQNNEAIDEVVVSVFKKPASYTGENIAEISSHGSPVILEKIIAAVTHQGARLAKPGEFTQRAFLNGKLDLIQAEAVADLIASNSEASRKAALSNIRGGFSEQLKILREELIKFSALIELELDFSQEDVEFADRKELMHLLEKLQLSIGKLITSFKLGNAVKNGVQVAIIGKPNAGKSTLLNTFLNENRAIVSEVAGTTRDTIEEVVNLDGILFRLIDTAGIRHHTTDLVEGIGVQKTYEKMQQADIVIYLFDVNEVTPEELLSVKFDLDEKGIKYLLTGNKIDLVTQEKVALKFSEIPVIFIAASKQINVEVLKQRLIDTVVEGEVNTENTIITSARHHEALRLIEQSLSEVQEGIEQNISGDLIALDIRRCLHFLGEITGEITNEDQMDYIFSKFCIGK